MGRVTEALGEGPIALDSSVFIYFVESHPRYAPAVREVFAAIDAGRLEAVTSAVSLLEVLVAPLRAGDRQLAATYEAVLTTSPGLTLREVDLPLLRAAAEVRASTGVRVPDALQLAAGLEARCTAFLTNDRRLPRVGRMRVVQLDAVLDA